MARIKVKDKELADDVIICRCEEVTLGEIRALIDQGYHTLDELKRITRCGMGPCQGRTCRPLIMQELRKRLGISYEDQVMPTFRPPAKPIKISTVVRGEADE